MSDNPSIQLHENFRSVLSVSMRSLEWEMVEPLVKPVVRYLETCAAAPLGLDGAANGVHLSVSDKSVKVSVQIDDPTDGEELLSTVALPFSGMLAESVVGESAEWKAQFFDAFTAELKAALKI